MSPCVFSTAAQQRSTGDECGPEDPRDEPKHPLSDCALEHKAVKLEEQVRDLTVSVLLVAALSFIQSPRVCLSALSFPLSTVTSKRHRCALAAFKAAVL